MSRHIRDSACDLADLPRVGQVAGTMAPLGRPDRFNVPLTSIDALGEAFRHDSGIASPQRSRGSPKACRPARAVRDGVADFQRMLTL